MQIKSLSIVPLLLNTVQATITFAGPDKAVEPLVMIVSVRREWRAGNDYPTNTYNVSTSTGFIRGDEAEWWMDSRIQEYLGADSIEEAAKSPTYQLWLAAKAALLVHYPESLRPAQEGSEAE